MKVENKVIIVTGAGAGIGKELTKQLIKKGAYIIGVDINEQSLKDLEKELGTEHLSTYIVNMGDTKSIKSFVKKVLKDHDHIDGLINNAGIIQPFVNVEDLDDAVFERVMNINFNGPVVLVRELIDHLKQRPIAHIVNVSSMAGFFPFPSQTIYGSSKAALKLFTEGLYAENIGTSVNVSIVFPGAIETDITKNSGAELKTDNEESTSSLKPMPADKAAKEMIKGMERGEMQIYVGKDAKFMHFLYKLSPKKAVKFIKNQIEKL